MLKAPVTVGGSTLQRQEPPPHPFRAATARSAADSGAGYAINIVGTTRPGGRG